MFRRSFFGRYLRCITPREAAIILEELHVGECGSHSSGRSLVLRARRAGYYWPTMAEDAKNMPNIVPKACSGFQASPEYLKSVSSPWTFRKWGMDIVGKFPIAPRQKVFLLIVTDNFSKWVEAEALRKITDLQIQKFMWVPQEIITDNGPQLRTITSKIFERTGA